MSIDKSIANSSPVRKTMREIVAERVRTLQERWPQPTPPKVTRIRGDGRLLSCVSVMVGLDEPRVLYVGLDQDTPYGRRYQVGEIKESDLGDVLRQLALAFGVERVWNEVEGLAQP